MSNFHTTTNNMANTQTKLLTFSDVSLSYTSKAVLSKINFTVNTQEILTIIGPNGAGKSSLVKLITGILPPTAGKVDYHTKCRIGYMPQSLHLSSAMPLKVSRFLSLANSSKQARQDALSLINIEHLASTQMQQLSGGELQRVLLARAILRKPNLLVLDEPLQGVDVNGQAALYRLIAQLRSTLNCAIIMVSHDLHLVMAQTDTVLCLNQHICCHGKPDNISQHPEYLKLFGADAAPSIAVYTHQHDHHHTMHGEIVPATSKCDDGCQHD